MHTTIHRNCIWETNVPPRATRQVVPCAHYLGEVARFYDDTQSQLFPVVPSKKFVEWKYVEHDISPRGISNRARNKGGTPCVHLLSFLPSVSFFRHPFLPTPPPFLVQATNHRLTHILSSYSSLCSMVEQKKKKTGKSQEETAARISVS